MRWNKRPLNGWGRRFALLPTEVCGLIIWLEPYWGRWHGDHGERRLTDPRKD